MREKDASDELVHRYFLTILQFHRVFMNENKQPPDKFPESTYTGTLRKHAHTIKHSEKMLMFALHAVSREFPNDVNVSDLSRLLHVKPPSITAPLNHLEKMGLVRRVQDEHDRRIVRVHITDEGQDFLRQAKDVFYERTRGLIDYLGEEKAKQYVSLMEDVLAYIKTKHEQHDQRDQI
ncbi:MarR family winged helix-turn-helix transcriptional regulator [Ethanoligenens harbinense]|uniref:Regulatory protein MarR n=1 Tax=Ethanoligenens harbinense (strain DSM 18485 / JCM 12961 / CGMCC 1.5033 / YUAN-3) TaxID=663278 RepID=E6U8L0_ETHHY|nr:MarR family transcriptional regulator [Ethanoligenens harbinense]ADU26001.1 regulatory protein MarR [Ethanoligenens harbinense YUAN-3]AVQ95148.1 hypothetical protein CXQ68_02130 [Ethanoligenens harbinense YUAN-3]AYF37839.1 hypothetical protein CXP51_02140 [Ethanoligenens harbinense]AYF40561.1 hypothetical protein CN246_02135 [Ethanoligenens harbinense]QCN91394.1 MarR family transcriptional regulator [Ethanoligenens harbinense]